MNLTKTKDKVENLINRRNLRLNKRNAKKKKLLNKNKVKILMTLTTKSHILIQTRLILKLMPKQKIKPKMRIPKSQLLKKISKKINRIKSKLQQAVRVKKSKKPKIAQEKRKPQNSKLKQKGRRNLSDKA